MTTLKDWWAKRKETLRKNELENKKADFKVAEKDGCIYLMHRDAAFAIVSKHATADEIAERLKEARDAALAFED